MKKRAIVAASLCVLGALGAKAVINRIMTKGYYWFSYATVDDETNIPDVVFDDSLFEDEEMCPFFKAAVKQAVDIAAKKTGTSRSDWVLVPGSSDGLTHCDLQCGKCVITVKLYETGRTVQVQCRYSKR